MTGKMEMGLPYPKFSGRGGGCTLKNWEIVLMGHFRDNIFVLDTRMSDPVGHLLGYLILAFNYSEGNIIILYICISFK